MVKSLNGADNIPDLLSNHTAQLAAIATIDVKNPGYGLTACKGDGTTDDTIALQAIVNKMVSLGKGILYFPAGTYIISSTITIANANTDTSVDITFRGQETISSVIQAQGNATNFDLFLVKTTSQNVRFCNFEKLFFSFGQNGIHGYQYAYSYIKDCIFMNQSNAGIFDELGMLLRIHNNHFLNTLNTNGTGVYISGLMGGAYGNHIITNNTFGEALYNGVIDTGYGSIIANNQFYWVKNNAIKINGDCHKIFGNMFTGFGSNGAQGVYILYGNKNEVYQNIFDNSQNNDNGTFTSPSVAAIYLVSANDTKIFNNQILGTAQTLSNGIVCNSASDHFQIFDNFFVGLPATSQVYNQNASAVFVQTYADLTNKVYNHSGLSLMVNNGTWNQEHLVLGNYHLWVDTNGKLRIKNGVPSSVFDGNTTQNFGRATLPTGTTSVVVNHNLPSTPSNIVATPIGNIGHWWISNLTSTQFTINSENTSPIDIAFSWRAEV